MGMKISLQDLFGFVSPKAIAFGQIDGEATVVGHDTPFPVFDSSLGKSLAIVLGANVDAAPGRYIAITTDVAGDVLLKLADNSQFPVKVVAGTNLFPLRVKRVLNGPAGTYHNLS